MIKSWLQEHRRIDHVIRRNRYFPRSFTKPRDFRDFLFFRVSRVSQKIAGKSIAMRVYLR